MIRENVSGFVQESTNKQANVSDLNLYSAKAHWFKFFTFTYILMVRSGFLSSFQRDLGSAQAFSRECKGAFVINVHILPNTFSSASGTQTNKKIKRLKQLQENDCKKYSDV